MKRILKTIPLLCLAALLGSCVKEELLQGGNVVEGEPAMVTVSMKGAQMGSLARALTPEEEKEIKNIHVMIFDNKGNLVTNTHFNSNADNLNVKTTSGNGRTIFVVANGDAHTDIDNDLFKVTKLADLNNIVVAFGQHDLKRPKEKGLIMTGQTAVPVDIKPGSSTLASPIQLSYLSAKVTLKLIDKTPSNQNVQVYSWDIVNAAGKAYLIEQTSKDAVDPTQPADFFTTANTYPFEVNDPATGTVSQVLYLFESRRGGRVDRALPTDATKRYTGMDKGDNDQRGKGWYAPPKATYIVIRGLYTHPTGAKQFEAYIYLGLDAIKNYDIARGNDYQFTVTVNGFDDINVDSNVDYVNAGFTVDHGTNLIMDAHPDFRPIRIMASAGSSTIEILDENGRAHNDPGFSATWLKISPLNLMYHQVKQAGAAGIHQQDGVVGDFVRAKYTPHQGGTDNILSLADATYNMAYRITDIPFTNPSLATDQTLCVYADEFLTTDGARTAQVKVTYLKNGDSEVKRESMILTLTQRGPLTIFDMNNNDAGLYRLNEDGTPSSVKRKFVIEQFEEVALAMNPGIDMSVQNTKVMQWGFRGVTPYYDKADKYRNGYFLTAEAVYTDVTRTNNEPTGFGITSSSLKRKYGNGLTNGTDYIPIYTGSHTGPPYYYPTVTNDIYHPIYKSSAARYCHEKNRDMDGDGYIDANETKWYLPSEQELQMIWIANNITSTFSANTYWSASRFASLTSFPVSFNDGHTATAEVVSVHRVRCVREL